MADIIQIRRDTQEQWLAIDPILAQGEFAVETDTNQFKIGDGSSVYSLLPYVTQGPDGAVGPPGPPGQDGADGEDGAPGQDGAEKMAHRDRTELTGKMAHREQMDYPEQMVKTEQMDYPEQTDKMAHREQTAKVHKAPQAQKAPQEKTAHRELMEHKDPKARQRFQQMRTTTQSWVQITLSMYLLLLIPQQVSLSSGCLGTLRAQPQNLTTSLRTTNP